MKAKQFNKFLRNTQKYIDGKIDKAPTLSLGPKRAMNRFSYLSLEDTFKTYASTANVLANATDKVISHLDELSGFFKRMWCFVNNYYGQPLTSTLMILSNYYASDHTSQPAIEGYEGYGRDTLLSLHHYLTMIPPNHKEELTLIRKWAHSSPFLKSFASIEEFRKSAINYLVEIDHRLGVESGGKTVLYYERILQPVLSDATLEALS